MIVFSRLVLEYYYRFITFLGTNYKNSLMIDIKGNIDEPHLLERLDIRVPGSTRFEGLFYLPVNHTNFANNSTLI